MSIFLPFAMQNFLNVPLAMHESAADMLVAALSGRLNIRELTSASGIHSQRDLDDLALLGRERVDAGQLSFVSANKTKSSPQRARSSRDKTFQIAGDVAIVPIKGTLMKDWGIGPYSGSTGYDGIQTQIMDAVQDADVKAIWMWIDSGGGTVNGLEQTADLIYNLREKNTGKPIWAMASDYAYSAAYMLGTAADRFYAPRLGGVGSVGTITMHADLSKKLENDGIKVTVIRAGKNKARANGIEPLDEETLAHIEAQCAEHRNAFIETVARNMGISKKSVAETEGLDYMGTAAKAIGFVTEVLPEPEVWGKLQRKINR